jgi:ABC-2 type transport system permease protein
MKFSTWTVFRRETRMECLRLLRAPSFSVPTIAFPVLFYLLFGILLGRSHGDPDGAKYYLALFIVFGTLAPGLFGLGVTLALERERGLLQLKRALPMPPGAYLGAKVAMAMVFAGLVSMLLLLIGITVAQVMLDIAQLVKLFGLSVFGVLPFCGMGLLLGTLVKGSAAPAVLNLVYLPMSFLSGLLVPLQALPKVFSQIAPIWPSYHLSRLALAVVGAGDRSNLAVHLLIPAAIAVLLFAIARRRLQNVR